MQVMSLLGFLVTTVVLSFRVTLVNAVGCETYQMHKSSNPKAPNPCKLTPNHGIP